MFLKEYFLNDSIMTMKYLPIWIVLGISVITSFVWSLATGVWSWFQLAKHFMGAFLLCFGFLKIIFYSYFVPAFRQYDLLGMKCLWYAKIYPFLEFFLGLVFLFLSKGFVQVAAVITALVMIQGSIGIILAIAQKKMLTCACVGGKFKLPLGGVSLTEDLLMLLLSILMIVF